MNAPLIKDFSIEMTAKDIPDLRAAFPVLPPGTRVNVTYLASEDMSMRLAACSAAMDVGLLPVPHISARRLTSVGELEAFLTGLESCGASEEVFVIGGDPSQPVGPYSSALDVIESGLLTKYGVKRVGVAGYPEGHPTINDGLLWEAMDLKAEALDRAGIESAVVTQFGFDVDAVVTWIERVRAHGIQAPIRVGVPGPTSIRRLLSFASRFGISSSAGIAKKYGFSIANVLGTAGPERFIAELGHRLDPVQHGDVSLHFYTFGGLSKTAEWVRDFAGA